MDIRNLFVNLSTSSSLMIAPFYLIQERAKSDRVNEIFFSTYFVGLSAELKVALYFADNEQDTVCLKFLLVLRSKAQKLKIH